MFYEETNLNVHLVSEGYASMRLFTACRSNFAKQIKNAEIYAKAERKRIWKNFRDESVNIRVGLKKTDPKKPPKKTKKNHLKKPSKSGFYWVLLEFMGKRPQNWYKYLKYLIKSNKTP